MTKHTIGEINFEKYMKKMGYEYDFELKFKGKTKRPDYVIHHKDRDYIIDVKDFEMKRMLEAGSYDPYKRIRGKIEEARRKFKEFKKYPCCLVLYADNLNPFFDISNYVRIYGAMEGDLTYRVPIPQSDIPQNGLEDDVVFGRRGKMRRPNSADSQNTTISAIISLIDLDDKPLHVIVWENRHARIPLSREIFDSALDERWEYNGKEIRKVY
ncbi:MAG: hypothetical protein U5O15_08045 [Candidatus Krumholzibacteriota bacterium]|nr:hypothetical protein [Candidatus Krumholzibacteriota bacterium]